MTTTSGPHDDTLTLLTWAQLNQALSDSADEYETRFAAFIDSTNRIAEIVTNGLTGLAEAQAEMRGHQASYKAQAGMTRMLAAEVTMRAERGDFA